MGERPKAQFSNQIWQRGVADSGQFGQVAAAFGIEGLQFIPKRTPNPIWTWDERTLDGEVLAVSTRMRDQGVRGFQFGGSRVSRSISLMS